ncbi:hypothetical protein [Paenibacillus sp. LjRoot56]|uniref:hypothetical protein n=1 Tax=Paenibacillus sp. LjRoot56 TaxID=3342333 RepID=UPI003ED139F8
MIVNITCVVAAVTARDLSIKQFHLQNIRDMKTRNSNKVVDFTMNRYLTLFIILILVILSGYANKEEVNLVANSDSWKFKVNYLPSKHGYIEKQTIEYIGKLSVNKVDISLNYKNNSSTVNTLKVESLVGVGPQQLPTKTEVDNWKDTKTVKITWTEKDTLQEETIRITPSIQE